MNMVSRQVTLHNQNGPERVPWLDRETAELVRDIIAEVARDQAAFRAAILYGSVARHEERALTDAHPSDVDLLLLFDLEHGARFTHEQRMAIFTAIGHARDRHLTAPHEVQIQLATSDLGEWDSAFVESVARDGLLLYARGRLPHVLAAIERRRW